MNAVLVFAVEQCESVTCICVCVCNHWPVCEEGRFASSLSPGSASLGCAQESANPGYSNTNGPNLDENWPKARFQNHWEESPRKGAGHDCTAHLWPHREQRRGKQAQRRGWPSAAADTLTPSEDRRAGADLGRETQGTHSRKECILSELIQSERNMPIFILFIFHWRIIAFHFQLKEFL